jgi:hypothetical protein
MKILASHVEKLCLDSESEVYDVPVLPSNQSRSEFSQLSRNTEVTRFEEIREMGLWMVDSERE